MTNPDYPSDPTRSSAKCHTFECGIPIFEHDLVPPRTASFASSRDWAATKVAMTWFAWIPSE